MILFPAYLGFEGRDEGFYDEMLANGPERCLAYGRFLGQRYRGYDNIIWEMGGDRDPGPARQDVDMVAYGIRQCDRRHLMTAHCHSDSAVVAQYPGSWLEIGSSYAYEVVHLLWVTIAPSDGHRVARRSFAGGFAMTDERYSVHATQPRGRHERIGVVA